MLRRGATVVLACRKKRTRKSKRGGSGQAEIAVSSIVAMPDARWMDAGSMFCDGNRDAFLRRWRWLQRGIVEFHRGTIRGDKRQAGVRALATFPTAIFLSGCVPNLLPSWIGPFFCWWLRSCFSPSESVHASRLSSSPRRQISPTTHRTVDGITTPVPGTEGWIH